MTILIIEEDFHIWRKSSILIIQSLSLLGKALENLKIFYPNTYKSKSLILIKANFMVRKRKDSLMNSKTLKGPHMFYTIPKS